MLLYFSDFLYYQFLFFTQKTPDALDLVENCSQYLRIDFDFVLRLMVLQYFFYSFNFQTSLPHSSLFLEPTVYISVTLFLDWPLYIQKNYAQYWFSLFSLSFLNIRFCLLIRYWIFRPWPICVFSWSRFESYWSFACLGVSWVWRSFLFFLSFCFDSLSFFLPPLFLLDIPYSSPFDSLTENYQNTLLLTFTELDLTTAYSHLSVRDSIRIFIIFLRLLASS